MRHTATSRTLFKPKRAHKVHGTVHSQSTLPKHFATNIYIWQWPNGCYLACQPCWSKCVCLAKQVGRTYQSPSSIQDVGQPLLNWLHGGGSTRYPEHSWGSHTTPQHRHTHTHTKLRLPRVPRACKSTDSYNRPLLPGSKSKPEMMLQSARCSALCKTDQLCI